VLYGGDIESVLGELFGVVVFVRVCVVCLWSVFDFYIYLLSSMKVF
jgi:hypothetical protein